MKSLVRVAVVASMVFAGASSSYGQARVQAVGGTNPHPMAVGGTNPHPMAVGGTNPYPHAVGSTLVTLVRTFLGF